MLWIRRRHQRKPGAPTRSTIRPSRTATSITRIRASSAPIPSCCPSPSHSGASAAYAAKRPWPTSMPDGGGARGAGRTRREDQGCLRPILPDGPGPRRKSRGDRPRATDARRCCFALRPRRNRLALGVAALGAIAAAAVWQWSWLVAVGIAPLLLSVAPCAAMCGLGLCMHRIGGRACAAPPQDGIARSRDSAVTFCKTGDLRCTFDRHWPSPSLRPRSAA